MSMIAIFGHLNQVGIAFGQLFEPVMMFFSSVCNIPVQYILPTSAYWYLRFRESEAFTASDYRKMCLHGCCFAFGCSFMVLGVIESVQAMSETFFGDG